MPTDFTRTKFTDRSGAVQVKGLSEFRAELKALDSRLPRELRLAGNEAANIVVPEAQRRGRSLGGVAAKAADSVKAASQQSRAAISLGGPRFPFALGAEFGGQRRPTTQQFEPWLEKQGYWFYPAIRAKGDEVVETYGDAIDRLMRRVYPD